MAKDSPIAVIRTYSKQTLIYTLSDPDTLEIRYLGKTVATLATRLYSHIFEAKRPGHKRHVLAWISGLIRAGKKPIIRIVETVPPFTDWVIVERRWIADLRAAGANLCNLTDGGQGTIGYKPPPEVIAKFRRSGPAHWAYGKPITKQTLEASLAALKVLREDPEWVAWAYAQRMAGFTPEILARNAEHLRRLNANPETRSRAEAARAITIAPPDSEFRKVIGAISKNNWRQNRESMKAAISRGKDIEWAAGISDTMTSLWQDPEYREMMEKARANGKPPTKTPETLAAWVSANAVRASSRRLAIAKEAGFTTTDDMMNSLITEYLAGGTTILMAKRLKISLVTLLKWLKDSGIDIVVGSHDKSKRRR